VIIPRLDELVPVLHLAPLCRTPDPSIAALAVPHSGRGGDVPYLTFSCKGGVQELGDPCRPLVAMLAERLCVAHVVDVPHLDGLG
jgi:hypothetical protein